MSQITHNQQQKEIKIFLDYLRNEGYTYDNIDTLSSYIISYWLLDKKPENVKEMNEILKNNYPDFVHNSQIDNQLFIKLSNLNFQTFNYNNLRVFEEGRSRGFFDINQEVAWSLAKLVKLQNADNIADFNCQGSTLLKEVIKYSNYIGNIHLYSININSLKQSFLNLYPENKKIKIHHIDIMKGFINEKFDFIYTQLPFGNNKDRAIAEIYVKSIKAHLKINGKAMMFVTSSFLFNRMYQKVRDTILHELNLEAIINLSNAFSPRTSVGTAILIVSNKQKPQSNTFVANYDFQDDDMEAIDIIVEKYVDFTEGKQVKSFYPLVNVVDTNELDNDFYVAKFDPVIDQIENKLSFKYEIKQLKDFCKIALSKSKYGKEDYHGHFQPELKGYIRIQNIKNNRVQPHDIVFVNQKNEREILTKEGDLLLSISGTIGKTGVVAADTQNCLYTHGLALLRPDENVINKEYFLYVLQSHFVVQQLTNFARGDFIKRVSKRDLESIKIPILPLKEQLAFISDINRVKAEIIEIEAKRAKLEAKIESLMDFGGK